MGESKSVLEGKITSVEKKNTIITLVALLVWLGISILGQAIFMDENERLDAGAIMVAGGGPILLISALHLLLYGIRSWGLIIRSILGIIFIGTGVGELTDTSKDIIWSSVGAVVLVVIGASVLWKAFYQR
ncbi:MAG: hypothetical protein JSV74_01565 [Dehalococcoidia bacterium]|nr:MAG: hypothetical protein JSV74_01565 [Dehalococcoidia bacterium]